MMALSVESLYETELRHLPLEERMRLLELIARDLRRAGDEGTKSILQLRGLGQEIWDGIDAQEYVDEMRTEWDHRC